MTETIDETKVAPNLCSACGKPMPFINEGLWLFRNGEYTLCVRLISKVASEQKKSIFSKAEVVESVVSHQLCLSCIKAIIGKLKSPEPTANKVICLPKK